MRRRTLALKQAGTALLVGAGGLPLAAIACDRASDSPPAPVAQASAAAVAPLASDVGRTAGGDLMHVRTLENRVAYVPPECFTMTRTGDGPQRWNPCYVCHTAPEAPNFTNDEDLQSHLAFPVPALVNPYTNLFAPAAMRAAPESDAEVLAYVRRSNYFDADGSMLLNRRLDALPREWDGDDNGHWDGFRPDVWFRFDDRGFDHAPDGTPNGWRAFAYYPFPGTFFPTNGSTDDVLIRLDAPFREDAQGKPDARIYELNLAIVEALIARASVAIDPVDEEPLGVDLDLDGRLDRAGHIAFDASPGPPGFTRMHYVGRAHELEKVGKLAISPGLFPLGTEFFHTVRYIDLSPAGAPTMAPRMKEVRYAKKIEWLPFKRLAVVAEDDARETQQSGDGARTDILWGRERGIYNNAGWVYQGFIEARDGSLRPQSFDETAACVGCHGGIGATTDSAFAFPRKIAGTAPQRGWWHWSQRDFRGVPEPKRIDGQYEYSLYLAEAGAGDDLRENGEVLARFFDGTRLRQAEVTRLHGDIARLLLPSPARAIALDRAYRAVVLEQSFGLGRGALAAPTHNVLRTVTIRAPTGIEHPVRALRLAR
jgi:hypothetical protein